MDVTTSDVFGTTYVVRSTRDLTSQVPEHLREGMSETQLLEGMLINYARQGFELFAVCPAPPLDGGNLHYFRRCNRDLAKLNERMDAQRKQILEQLQEQAEQAEEEFCSDDDCPGRDQPDCCLHAGDDEE